ncbi:hypothetical protein ACLX1H_000058 [Fusarium chlamydosporum]
MSRLQSLAYTKIPSNHIRLLRINTEETVSDTGNLETVSLDEAPPFYALSHCWGTQDRNVPVQINEQLVYVTPNLAAGLKVLQNLATDDACFDPPLRYIWIDSICINQQSISDRSSQVALMRSIYSASATTLIWLGTESTWVSSAWRLVEQIYDVCQKRHPDAKVEADIPVGIYSDAFHALTDLPSWDDDSWAHLTQMMKIEWFSRIWVIQEVVLSPQDPVIIWGQHLYPWHKLQWASAWLRKSGYARLSQIPEKLLNVYNMGNLRHCRAKWPLDALMSFTMTKFHATDPRDKIFGLLGIASECQDPSQIPEALKPDYSADLAQTYLKVARFLLENGSSLAILTRAHGAGGCSMRKQRVQDFVDLPSWTPDWSDFRVFNKCIRTSLAKAHFSDREEPPRLGFAESYAASAGLKMKLHESEDISFLSVSAVNLGTVTHCYYFDEKEGSKEDFKQAIDSKLHTAWNTALEIIEVADLASWATNFIKATTAERYDLIRRSCEQTIKDGMAYLVQQFENVEAKLALPFMNDDRMKSLELLRPLSIGGDAKAYVTLAYTYCFDRCFVVTSTGNVGIGPSDTQVGDCTAVILGSDVPYVLRRNGSSWVFIGELYLEGYMNGQVAEMMEKGVAREEI